MNRSTAIVGFWVLGYLVLCYVISALLPPIMACAEVDGESGRFAGDFTRAILLAMLGLVLLALFAFIRWCWRLLSMIYDAIERSM